jgi:hypothetical protein
MYAWLWRVLPGPAWMRVLLLVILAVGLVAVLFTWVFPALAPFVPFNDVDVDG